MLDSGKSNSRAHPASGTPTYAHSPTTHKTFHPFTPEETSTIQHHLDQPIEADQIQFRPSAQGSVAYVEGWKALSLANEVFGFNGWSSEILYWGVDFVDCEDGRVSLGISCMVRIHLRDGTFHDDIGYGSAENQRSKAAAYEKARKEAVTDAMKRALRVFGNRLGNCAYDKAFLKQVRAASSHVPYRPQGTHQPTSTTSNGSHTAPTLPPIKISNNPAPVNFAPQWKHPKTLNNHEANPSAASTTRPPPPIPLASNVADSEMELDLVVTEERNASLQRF